MPFKKVDTSWKAAQQMMTPPPNFLELTLGLKQKIDDGLVPKSNFPNIQDLLELEHLCECRPEDPSRAPSCARAGR